MGHDDLVGNFSDRSDLFQETAEDSKESRFDEPRERQTAHLLLATVADLAALLEHRLNITGEVHLDGRRRRKLPGRRHGYETRENHCQPFYNSHQDFKSFLTTDPSTSVNRKFRPMWLYVKRV